MRALTAIPIGTIIVGAGRAGGSLHLNCLDRLRERGDLPPGAVAVVDLRPPSELRLAHRTDITFFTSLREAGAAADPDAVVHICSPPRCHLDHVTEAVEGGFRRLVVEKPLAVSGAEAEAIARLGRSHGVAITAVLNWAFSRLTTRLVELAGPQGSLIEGAIHLSQNKPRIRRSLSDTAHSSVLEIEMPHMVAAALRIKGAPARVATACCEDLVIGDVVRRRMASGRIVLTFPGGSEAIITSDMQATRIERFVTFARTDGGAVWGHYPCSEADDYAQLVVSGPDGTHREVFADDTLGTCLRNAYEASPGDSLGRLDLNLGVDVCRVLDEAKHLLDDGPADPPRLSSVEAIS